MLLMGQNTTMRVYYALCLKTYSGFGKVLQSRASSRQAPRGARICETGLLVQMMACGLFDAKPLSEPMLKYC